VISVQIDFESKCLSHPLPRVVLTSSKFSPIDLHEFNLAFRRRWRILTP